MRKKNSRRDDATTRDLSRRRAESKRSARATFTLRTGRRMLHLLVSQHSANRFGRRGLPVRDARRHELAHLGVVNLQAALADVPVLLAQFHWWQKKRARGKIER